MRLTEKKIQEILLPYLLETQKISYGVPNVLADGIAESDLLAVNKKDFLINYEIKISKRDFYNELKKRRTRYIKNMLMSGSWHHGYGIPNYFYYVVPEKMITKEDVEKVYKEAGLIYVKLILELKCKDGKFVRTPKFICYCAKNPKRFHDKKVDESIKKRMSVSLFWRWWKLYKKNP